MASTADVSFHWADYVAFSIVLAISAAIGLFAAFRHRRATAEQLLTGNRKLPLFPVVMSLTATFISAITVLGLPVETYVNSAEYWLVGLGYIPAQLLTAFFIMPIIYRLKVTSAYQYLEFRFNRTIRLCGSLTFILLMLLYMAVVMYAPALALSQVTGLSEQVSILATGLVCTIYTALGGIKAVVWTDSFQTLVIIAGLITMVIRGTMKVGGWGVVMDRALRGRRFTWELDLNPDPFVRHTFWTLVIGGFVWSLAVFSANQAMLQRYISMRTMSKAKGAILINLLMLEVCLALAMLTGLVIYAFYYGCDPLTRGLITKPDQLVPFFMVQVLNDLPGLSGLFVASVYSASLSTVSSGVNSLAAVMLEDFFRPWVKAVGKGKESERLKSAITVVSAIVFGVVTVGLAYLAGALGHTVVQVALSVYGMVGGPLLGLMLLGILFPPVNSWGAGAAWFCSLLVSLWTGIGAILTPPASPSSSSSSSPSAIPPLTTALCNLTGEDPANGTLSAGTASSGGFGTMYWNATTTGSSVEETTADSDSGVLGRWYGLSYQYYAILSLIVALLVGPLVSAMTGFNKNRYVDRRTYVDVLSYFRKKKPEEEEEEEERAKTEDMTRKERERERVTFQEEVL